jgi:oxygen-independent coproporphyrinogen-3 oxidase
MELIHQSEKILNEQNLKGIWDAGIHRDPISYHHTVMYPPLKIMRDIAAKDIFTNFENRNNDFSLYIHIPFCSGKCSFCYYYKMENENNEQINEYLIALKKEILMVKEKIEANLGAINVKSLFLGGGSPTLLNEAQFADLIEHIRNAFNLSNDYEFTVEVHPEIVRNNGKALLECYFSQGVNRLNIGIQSFDDHILEITNRRHTAEEAFEAFALARGTGFKNINIDLIYPLPDLSPEIWRDTLDSAFRLQPESITTYFIAIRKPSPIYELYQNAVHRFPNETSNHLFRIMTMEKAKVENYSNELIDWFVKPREGFHYQHQINEVRKSEEIQLLSFGSGVFTYLNHYQYYNYPDIHKYCDSIANNVLPIWKGIKLSKEERLSRAMVLGMKSGVVNIKNIGDNFREDIVAKYGVLLDKLQKLGLLQKSDGDLRLTEKGALFADEIAVQFISRDVKKELEEKRFIKDLETEMINTYNFMYDTERIRFL